jgi:putative transposase
LATVGLASCYVGKGIVSTPSASCGWLREEGLKLRPKRRKRVASVQRVQPAPPTGTNQRWTLDFVSDTLSCGRRFRALSIVDAYSRECLAIEVDTSLSSERVVCVLERLRRSRGLPQLLQVDNGPEFSGRRLDEWAYGQQVKIHFIDPGRPTQNGHVESFQGKFRDESLNQEWFVDLADARQRIERWRTDYKWVRPHSSLDDMPPAVWALQHRQAGTLAF